MTIKDRVIANAASLIVLANKGELTWAQVSLMVDAFELGVAELAEEVGVKNLGDEAYKYTKDIHQYLANKGVDKKPTRYCTDIEAINLIIKELSSTLNFKSRRICAEVQKRY